MRSRQTEDSQKSQTKKQKDDALKVAKSNVSGLNDVPVTSFDPNTLGEGLLGVGLLNSRPLVGQNYSPEINPLGKPHYSRSNVSKYTYFFLQYNNLNTYGIDGLIKSFAVIETLNPLTISQVSNMLGYSYKKLTGIAKEDYDTGSFIHPTYKNQNDDPLSIRYAEIPIIKQITPGRLDNIPLGYPNFDSTPDGITTRVGPVPTAPYTDFSTDSGATSSTTITPGGTVGFRDTSVRSPWQFAPTGWYWEFGATASPTGSTGQNPVVTYGATGNYTVKLTASNSYGSTTKIKNNFVIVTY